MAMSHWIMAALAASLFAAVSWADDVKVQVNAPGAAARSTAGATAHRASKMIGMAVKNSAGESLGKVNDLVIDERGSVRYAAVQFGGFAGFNAKLFAVPWSSFAIKNDVDSDNRYAELNIDKKVLEQAPGFPSDKWPDFADQSFQKDVDAFYLKHAPRNKVEVERK
jgi:sporulation protein YlmC with PRC-barrel domain